MLRTSAPPWGGYLFFRWDVPGDRTICQTLRLEIPDAVALARWIIAEFDTPATQIWLSILVSWPLPASPIHKLFFA